MKFHRIKAVLLQQLFISQRSLEVFMDLFFGSLVAVIAIGFFNRFLTTLIKGPEANYILLGTLLWIILWVNEYAVSVNTMWNIWSRNLSNMFVTPLTIGEYMLAHMASGLVLTVALFIPCAIIASALFGFNVLSLGLMNIFIFFLNLTLFGWAVGIILIGIVFRFGTRLQALTWGLVAMLQPLTAAFFPLSVLPLWLRAIAYLMPPTYVFEAARAALSNPAVNPAPCLWCGVNWEFTLIALVQNIVYLILALWFFKIMFRASKNSGQFAKNEV